MSATDLSPFLKRHRTPQAEAGVAPIAVATEVILTGLRTHKTAGIADPVDAGCLAKYASQG